MAQSKTSWPFKTLGALGALGLAGIAYIAGSGGPEKAWLGVRAVIWGHPAPKIVSLEPERGDPSMFILVIRNPALEDVVVTGYEATTLEVAHMNADINVSEPVANGAGNAPLIQADEQEPNPCDQPRNVHLPRPIVIEPGRTVALKIRPWDQPCPFEVKVFSDHGTSAKADTIEGLFRQFRINPANQDNPR
jgi:hypothetical protein